LSQTSGRDWIPTGDKRLPKLRTHDQHRPKILQQGLQQNTALSKATMVYFIEKGEAALSLKKPNSYPELTE
jgi:hypothetical protein